MRDNIFKKEILDYASKLDAVTNAYGKIVKSASAIVEEHDNSSTIYLITYASNIIKSTESTKDLKRLANALKDSIMKFYGYYYILESQDKRVENDNDTRSLDELLGCLFSMLGILNRRGNGLNRAFVSSLFEGNTYFNCAFMTCFAPESDLQN